MLASCMEKYVRVRQEAAATPPHSHMRTLWREPAGGGGWGPGEVHGVRSMLFVLPLQGRWGAGTAACMRLAVL